MSRRSAGDLIMIAVAAITLLSAAAQVVAPARALSTLGLRADQSAILMLILASSFSAVFGAAHLQTVLSRQRNRTILLWVALAKFCGPLVLGVAVIRGIAATAAVWIAAYDTLAGVLVLWYRGASLRLLTTPSRLEASHGEHQAAELEA